MPNGSRWWLIPMPGKLGPSFPELGSGSSSAMSFEKNPPMSSSRRHTGAPEMFSKSRYGAASRLTGFLFHSKDAWLISKPGFSNNVPKHNASKGLGMMPVSTQARGLASMDHVGVNTKRTREPSTVPLDFNCCRRIVGVTNLAGHVTGHARIISKCRCLSCNGSVG